MRSSGTILLVLLVLSVVPPPAIGQTAPISAHWMLDETTGTTAADSSPNGNTGTLVNFLATPWVGGVYGNGLTFDGVNDYVTATYVGGLPPFDGSGAPYSITAWVQGPPQDDDRIFAEGSSTSTTPLFTLGSGRTSNATDDKLQVFIRDDSNISVMNRQSTLAVFDNAWHHVAWVDVGGQARLYVEWILDGTNFNYVLNGTWTNLDRLALGAVLRTTTCCYFTGTLDDVRIYPFALTALDVATIINNGTLLSGFQVNQPGASLDVNGVVGSPASPALVALGQGVPFPLTLSTDQGGQLYELLVDSGPPLPNALLGVANIVNLSLASPTLIYLNGFFTTPFGVAPPLPGVGTGTAVTTSTLNLTTPGSPGNVAVQFFMIDPTSPDLFSASGAMDLVIQ